MYLISLLRPLLLFLLTGFAFAFTSHAQSVAPLDSLPNDPFKLKWTTLSNGLKVYLSVNRDQPTITTQIIVNTGSTNDPADATGLAHYLEHMLFKGTSELGSLNWEAEKPLLEQISSLYEDHRTTTDSTKRKMIYGQIDSLSQLAAQYVATNEYDQITSALGARGTNAYTSNERTVYINTIPSGSLAKWMALEGERFSELVLRLFHTELEAVFEEYNRTLDSDGRQAWYALNAKLFEGHNYGEQTTIGTGEHLKNPSMEKIHAYFKKYYVPNNMAIVLSGDFDESQALALIQQHFGTMERGPEPSQYKNTQLKQRTAVDKIELTGAESEFVQLAWRVGGAQTDDELFATLCAEILNNDETGLFDINLNQKQRVLSASAYTVGYRDYTSINLSGQSREGQTLEEVEQFMLDEIEKLKKGNFDNDLMASIVRNFKKDMIGLARGQQTKTYLIPDAFIFDLPWESIAFYPDRLSKITKEELVEWANKNLITNYVVVYKRSGERKVNRLPKPEITPVPVNREVKSEFRKSLAAIPEIDVEPQFLDFDKQLESVSIRQGLEMRYMQNSTDDLFSLYYVFDFGSRNDKELALAIELLPYLGTSRYSAEEVKKQFYDLALEYSVSSTSDRIYVRLGGLDESFDRGLNLFEELLNDVQGNEEAYKNLVNDILKSRKDDKKSKFSILYSGLYNHALYGVKNPFTDRFSEEELRAYTAEALAARLRDLSQMQHEVFYYGPRQKSAASLLVKALHKTPDVLQAAPKRATYNFANNTGKVFFAEYDQVQAEIMLISPDTIFQQQLLGDAYVFNEYFGSGLSSIVFQELRESKALAYSAYCNFGSPTRRDEHHIVRAYIGTQADKLPEATQALQELMTEMPLVPENFQQAKEGALKQLASSRATHERVYFSYLSARDRGFRSDPSEAVYNDIRNVDEQALQAFFDNHIRGGKFTYVVIGKRSAIDFDALSQLGEVVEVDLETLFGY